jgi:GT2 family glycosyltransferase
VADERVAVVVLSLNARETTRRCLESLLAIREPPFRVVLWDNGSSDGTCDAVRAAFPDVLVHACPTNLGVASGRNAAARLAIERLDPTHLLFLDNDMTVDPRFVGALLEPFREDDRLGQAQAKLRFMDDPQRLNDGGGCRIRFWIGETRPVGFGEIDRGQRDRRAPCISCGGAMMTRRDVFERLGGFDSAFDPVGPEDLDYSLRLQRAGYRALYVPEAVAWHAVSHTYGGGRYTEAYARHKARNWLKFLRRHGAWHQQLAFFAVGAPLLVLRMLLREARRGNAIGATRGLLRGAVEALRPKRGR